MLKPVVPTIMETVIQQIVSEPPIDCVSVCNNAAWATGEIALQYNGDAASFEPFVQPLIERLVPILLNPKAPKSLSENAAVTIGRMGLVCPAQVGAELPTFAQAWCTALWEIKDNAEKDSAFRGFCMMISSNPAGIQSVRLVQFLLFDCNGAGAKAIDTDGTSGRSAIGPFTRHWTPAGMGIGNSREKVG